MRVLLLIFLLGQLVGCNATILGQNQGKLSEQQKRQEAEKKLQEKKRKEEIEKEQALAKKIRGLKEFKFADASKKDFQNKLYEIYNNLDRIHEDRELVDIFTAELTADLESSKHQLTGIKEYGNGLSFTFANRSQDLSFGNSKAIKYVLKAAVKTFPDIKIQNGKTAFQMLVAKEGAEDIVEEILNDDEQVKALNLNWAGNLPYPFAASQKMLEVLEKKLGKMADKNVGERSALLRQAAEYSSDANIISYLLKQGALVDKATLVAALKNSTMNTFEILRPKLHGNLTEGDWEEIFLDALNSTNVALETAQELLAENKQRALATKEGLGALHWLFKSNPGTISTKENKMAFKLIEAGAPIYGNGTEIGPGKLSPAAFAIQKHSNSLLKAILNKAKQTNLLDKVLAKITGNDGLSLLQDALLNTDEDDKELARTLIGYGARVENDFLDTKVDPKVKGIYQDLVQEAEKKN